MVSCDSAVEEGKHGAGQVAQCAGRMLEAWLPSPGPQKQSKIKQPRKMFLMAYSRPIRNMFESSPPQKMIFQGENSSHICNLKISNAILRKQNNTVKLILIMYLV